MSEGLLNIEQTAKLLDICKDTVRKRIKTGEIKAEKQKGPYGEQYMINPNQFNVSSQTIEVIPVTRQVSLPDLISAIKSEVMGELKAELQEIKDGQKKIENLINDRDIKLLETIRQRQEESKKPWWGKLFS